MIFRDIVPIERTKFDSYEEFLIKASDNFFPDEVPPSSVGEKCYHYSVSFDRQSAVSFQLEEAAYEEEKKKYVEKRKQKCDELHSEVRKYVWDEGEPRKVTKEFMEAEDLMFVDNVCSKGVEEYYYLLDYKAEMSNGFFTWGIICNDEAKELIFYLYHDNGLFGVGDA
ncbi:MAG: hypothetical protein NC092_01285 [Butyrivibrio sp.]|nr:hypothetical protein [Muribaculum sp.]MCM1551306.1 hypothetical protein [Butyrivibrio sp.]